jgi:hypothetical protein
MDRAGAGWTLCALAVFAGTYFAFIERDLLWGGVLTVGGMLGYFWVLGRAMVGRWDNFKKF